MSKKKKIKDVDIFKYRRPKKKDADVGRIAAVGLILLSTVAMSIEIMKEVNK